MDTLDILVLELTKELHGHYQKQKTPKYRIKPKTNKDHKEQFPTRNIKIKIPNHHETTISIDLDGVVITHFNDPQVHQTDTIDYNDPDFFNKIIQQLTTEIPWDKNPPGATLTNYQNHD